MLFALPGWTLPRSPGKIQGMSSNAERLAAAVLARRTELELTQLEVWQRNGGPSNTTLTLVESARIESLTRTTARKLDKGLQWEDGSARRVWDGVGEATPLLKAGMRSDDSKVLRRAIEEATLRETTRLELLRVLDRAEEDSA